MKIPPQLLTVATHLGRLTESTVFVGGMIRGLLITDPGPPMDSRAVRARAALNQPASTKESAALHRQ